MTKKLVFSICCALCMVCTTITAQNYPFDGLNMNMGNLPRLSNAQTRSISPENFTGEKGKAGMAAPQDKVKRNAANAAHAAQDLGKGWKVNPYIYINSNEVYTLADIQGPGAIQQIWMTPQSNLRSSIIRIYWDNEKTPSVECPTGDFFCNAYDEYAQLSSLAVCNNPNRGYNCYWQMPFRKRCKITIENRDKNALVLYYQINYTLTSVPKDMAYFHAQFRQSKPTQGSIHTLADGIKGKGQYVGTYMACRVHNTGWWGEGEIKFYIDDDNEYPTICGTGTEDYFCGSNNFENTKAHKYQTFSTPYSGLHQVSRPEEIYVTDQCFGLYRWHILDPIRFNKNLKVTIQDLGWRDGGYYKAQQSDISTTVFWYQTEPHAPFPLLPKTL